MFDDAIAFCRYWQTLLDEGADLNQITEELQLQHESVEEYEILLGETTQELEELRVQTKFLRETELSQESLMQEYVNDLTLYLTRRYLVEWGALLYGIAHLVPASAAHQLEFISACMPHSILTWLPLNTQMIHRYEGENERLLDELDDLRALMQERKSPETALEDLPDAATADQLTEALRVAEETAAEASATKAYSSYFS